MTKGGQKSYHFADLFHSFEKIEDLKQATCIQAKQRSHNVVNWRNPFPVVLTSGRGRNVLLRDNGDLAEAER